MAQYISLDLEIKNVLTPEMTRLILIYYVYLLFSIEL